LSEQCPFGSHEYGLNPYPFYEESQASSGVYKVPDRNDYLLTRYEDVVRAATSPQVFSNYMPASAGVDVDGKHFPFTRTVPKYDAPEHPSIRSLAVQAFTASRVASYEPMILEYIDELFRSFEMTGTVECIAAVAQPLPMLIISEILGSPLDGIKMYKQWSDAASAVQSGYNHLDTQEDITSVHRNFGEMFTFLNDQIADRRAHPRGDALSLVVNPPADSDLPRLNAVELVGVAQSLLTAGNETTTLLLGNLMFRLVTNPQERERLTADPSGMRRFVEECLRIDTPAQWLPRTCLVDNEVGGVTVPAGARVLLMWGAANRDSAKFQAPAEFDSRRDSLNRHLAFGQGAHICLGAPLARLEGRLVAEAVLERLGNPRLDGEDAALRLSSVVHRGFKELRIRFDPSLPAAR
jgi:cytochrome P450